MRIYNLFKKKSDAKIVFYLKTCLIILDSSAYLFILPGTIINSGHNFLPINPNKQIKLGDKKTKLGFFVQ